MGVRVGVKICGKGEPGKVSKGSRGKENDKEQIQFKGGKGIRG